MYFQGFVSTVYMHLMFLYHRKISRVLFLSTGFVSIMFFFVLFNCIRSIMLTYTHTHSTFVCPTEILAFSDRVEEFHAINTRVVACSVDSKYTHYAWINTPRDEGGLSGLNIPLLSDITKQISKDYGVLLEDMGFSLRYAVPCTYIVALR